MYFPQYKYITFIYLYHILYLLFSVVEKPSLAPSYIWHFGLSGNNSVAFDEVRGRAVHLEGGAVISNTTERGLVADTNSGWLSLKETNGE